MTVRAVLIFGDPRLRQPAAPVSLEDPALPGEASDLLETLRHLRGALGMGRALAGPQIGIGKRMIAFDCALGAFVALNPRIPWRSDRLLPVWDDCFSFPDIRIQVERHESISLTCLNERGEERRFEHLPFALAELVQHEIDHLDGTLMVDRMRDGRAARALFPASAPT